MKHRVVIMKCDEYDPKKIAAIVAKGMEELNVVPRGRVLIKPNCGLAHPVLFQHSYTRAEFLEGVIEAIKQKGRETRKLVIGENSGITIPTRFCFKHAGYLRVLARQYVEACYFDETLQVPVHTGTGQCLRDPLVIPQPITECDFFVNLPKFKAHPWTLLSLGMKNYIGIQSDENRLLDHNAFLEHKIADLQHVIQPGFIAIDAIIAGQKRVMDPEPFPMNAILMGTNSCAVDAVGCHMVHVNPQDVIHLRIAASRGLGPIDMSAIEVVGDYPLAQIRRSTTSFKLGKKRVDDNFQNHMKVKCTVGTFPDKHATDYCWGGCTGLLLEAMHLHEQHSPQLVEQMAKIRFVVGNVEGPLDLDPEEKVIFVGDCCRWQGSIGGVPVKIEGNYVREDDGNNRAPRSNDLVMGFIRAYAQGFGGVSRNYVHVRGCPVAGIDLGIHLARSSGLPSVPFDSKTTVSLFRSYLAMHMKK